VFGCRIEAAGGDQLAEQLLIVRAKIGCLDRRFDPKAGRAYFFRLGA
jgi:hypothetical protein